MRKNHSGVFAFAFIVVGVLGCSGIKNMLPKNTQYFEGDAAEKAAQAIRDKIGKPFKVTEVFIDEDEFRVHAQDPNKPKNIDEYKYIAGFVTGPTPVQLGGMIDDPEKSSFPFDEIDFTAVPKFSKEAIDRAGIEGGKIYRLTFKRGFALTDKGLGALGAPRWHIEINGARENVTAVADPKGKVLGVDLSGTAKAADYKLLDESELQKAQTILKDYLGDRKEMIEMVFYQKLLMFKVPNAENPNVSDDYKYDINGLARSGFVKMGIARSPGESNYSIDDVDFADAVRFFEKAKTRVGLPNASLVALYLKRSSSPFDNKGPRTEWHVVLQSGVNQASVVYDNDGTETRAMKNGAAIGGKK